MGCPQGPSNLQVPTNALRRRCQGDLVAGFGGTCVQHPQVHGLPHATPCAAHSLLSAHAAQSGEQAHCRDREDLADRKHGSCGHTPHTPAATGLGPLCRFLPGLQYYRTHADRMNALAFRSWEDEEETSVHMIAHHWDTNRWPPHHTRSHQEMGPFRTFSCLGKPLAHGFPLHHEHVT